MNIQPLHGDSVILAQKPLTPFQNCAVMILNLTERIESCRQQAGLDSKAGTSESTSEAESTALNTLLSWRNTLAACFDWGKTSTMSTESETTTDWKTLNFCLSQITLADITPAESRRSGLSASASNAARYFDATLAKLNATQELSALASAIEQDRTDSLDVDGNVKAQPIIVARKPLEGTVVANVLKWGTGAINIDACRIATNPTVKPTALMRYLCRLVTPPNGAILDPFMGSGSTGKAATLEGFNFIGIEKEAEYVEIAMARINPAD
jgi:hypothetical protein